MGGFTYGRLFTPHPVSNIVEEDMEENDMSDDSKIHLSFTYTKDDFLHAWRFYRSSAWIIKLGKPLAIIIVAMFIIFTVWTGFQWYYLILAIVAIDLWFDFTGEARCRIYYRSNKSAIEETYDVTVDDTGIHVKSRTLEAKRSWDGYINVMESERLFLLVRGKGLFGTYPKRAFENEGQINEFRRIATKNILRS
jgi:hypothetical protein